MHLRSVLLAANPEAKIYAAVTNSWDDPDKEKSSIVTAVGYGL